MDKKLLFRRQFIITQRENKLKDWKEINLFEKFNLYSHPDLNIIDITLDNKRAILLGYLIDPNNIGYTDYDILRDTLDKSKNFSEFQINSKFLSGRWVLIFISNTEKKMFNDPATARHIYYSTSEEMILGSNSNIINYYKEHTLNNDKEYLEYTNSRFFKINEGEWYLDVTRYRDIFKLLPNHYFDLIENKTCKFWIETKYIDYEDSINRACEIMINSLKSLDKRNYYKLLALTAGYDSRVVYAVSHATNINNKYFLSTMNTLKEDHPDLVIASQILKDDDRDLIIIDNLAELTEDFTYYYQKNIDSSRIYPKTLTAQHMLYSPDFPNNTLILTGNYSEIFKDYYKKTKASSGKEITKLIGIPKKYTIFDDSFDNWINENKGIINESKINMMDLFFWEHRLPNFGVNYVANQDIAAEEFSIFNNRELFMVLIKAKYANKTNHTKIFKDIIERMHPRLMTYPINPTSGKASIAKFVKRNVSKRTREQIKLILKR
ncbi:hypothetical protein ACKRLN_00350 [Anaerococcus sp. DFU013_CI05]|uniref:hypothetical protein n=1 Tax=Anaerococcus sp. AH8042_DFU013_CI05 TaxID=3385202 RepID=UPI003A521969